MTFLIRCTCGNELDIPAGRAGARVRCTCGRVIEAPCLTDLQHGRAAGDADRGHGHTPRAATGAVRGGRAGGKARETGECQEGFPGNLMKGEQAPREFLIVLASDHVLVQRVHHEAFVHFAAAFERTVKAFAGKTEACPGVDIQIGYAMFPGGRRLVDLQIRPDVLPPHVVSELRMELDALRQPPVEGGPVSFCCRAMLWGGAGEPHSPFLFPFSSYFGGRTAPFDQLLTEAAGLSVPPAASAGGAARRFGRWCRAIVGRWARPKFRLRRDPTQRAEPPSGATATATSGAFPRMAPEPADPARGYTIAELTELLRQYPDYARLYKMRAEAFEQMEAHEQAIADYTSCLAVQPDQAEILVRRAMVHCVAGSHELGLKDLEAALRLNPESADALAGRGMIYLQLAAWDRALADFDAAVSHDRRNPSLQVHRGRTLIGREDYSQAVEALTQAIRLDPHHDVAYAWRGLARRRSSPAPSDDAIQAVLADFDAALDIQPDHTGYRLFRAEARLGAGDPRGAVADCDLILTLLPQSGEAYALRGIARQRLGDSPGAVQDCDAALELDAESADIYLARAFAHEDLGDLDAALTDCEAALELGPQEAVAINLRGAIRLQLGELDQALADFDAAIAIEPDWALPYANRGNACRVRGDNATAIRAYGRAIQLNPELVVAYLNRALAWADAHEDDKSLADFAHALRLDPRIVGAYVERASLRVRREEFDAALSDLTAAIRLQPDLARAYLQRGRVHCQRGNLDDALRDYDRLIDLAPDWAAAYTGRANVWLHKGDLDRADADFQQAVACEPEQAEPLMVDRLLLEAAYFNREERYDQAIRRTTAALELDANSVPAYALRAEANWYAEQLVEALDDLDEWIRRSQPADVHAKGVRGQVYAELGEFELALAELDEALALARKRPGVSTETLSCVYAGRALALAGVGRFDESVHDFELARQTAPNSVWTYYNQGLVLHTCGNTAAAVASFRQALEKREPRLPARKRERVHGFLRRYAT